MLRVFTFAAAALLVLTQPLDARGSCAADSPPVLAWSYPADGDTDVPTNAQVWVLFSLGATAEVTLNGVALTKADDSPFRWGPGPLSPDTEYTLAVHLDESEGTTTTDVTLTFTTGSEALTEPPPAPDLSQGWSETKTNAHLTDPSCKGAVAIQECYDTGQDTHLRFPTT